MQYREDTIGTFLQDIYEEKLAKLESKQEIRYFQRLQQLLHMYSLFTKVAFETIKACLPSTFKHLPL